MPQENLGEKKDSFNTQAAVYFAARYLGKIKLLEGDLKILTNILNRFVENGESFNIKSQGSSDKSLIFTVCKDNGVYPDMFIERLYDRYTPSNMKSLEGSIQTYINDVKENSVN